jgi:rare lipoprotein A
LRVALWTALLSFAVVAAICAWFWWSAPSYAGQAVCRGQAGWASWYGYTGRRGADGSIYTGRSMTAAHRSLAFGSRVRVTDTDTGRSIVVTITDRGPYIRGRVIDLSPAARRALGMGGLAKVCLTPG